VRFAFELAVEAQQEEAGHINYKIQCQGFSMVLWDRAFAETAEQIPDVRTESLLVDAAAMNFIRRPESFDVVVGSNLFCDILSDISAIIIGSMGLAASANLDPFAPFFPLCSNRCTGRRRTSAARVVSNPLATILSGAMMLDHSE
jgi:tartrate dehydrogenase/decarboxylase/D-malate dehydrogenase